jgi:phosphohistidine phosphatase
MLRLLLLRHSKATPHTRTGDHERALTERGRNDAARLGAHIAGEGIALQGALHSGARRAKETLDIVLKTIKQPVPVSTDARLYEATGERFLTVIRSRRDDASCLLVVGHNPSIAETARGLAGKGDTTALLKMAARFPTSALAIIDFEADRWSDIEGGAGRLIEFVTPAALGGRDD